MGEPSNNIMHVCQDCKEQELKMFQENIENELAEMEARLAAGKMVFIKAGFDIIGEDSQEHMWVNVHKVDRVQERVIGYLDNEPESNVGYEHRDVVEIDFDKIENALWEGRTLRMPNHLLH